MKPIDIQHISDFVFAIRWDDGVNMLYFADKTRAACPCATCREEREKQESNKNPFRVLKSDPTNVIFTGHEPIGRYAIRFTFSDRHTTGIYTYDYLREIGEREEG